MVMGLKISKVLISPIFFFVLYLGFHYFFLSALLVLVFWLVYCLLFGFRVTVKAGLGTKMNLCGTKAEM